MTGGSGSGKTNSLFGLKNHSPDIAMIYLYAKDSCKAQYQFLFNKRESTRLKHLNNSKGFIKYLNNMDDIYKNIEEYNSNKKSRLLIAY